MKNTEVYVYIVYYLINKFNIIDNMNKKNLVLVREENDLKYFTTSYKAAKYLGVLPNKLNYALVAGKPVKVKDGRKIDVEIVDGSGILYKLIDNE